MAAKRTLIPLISASGERLFELEHAENIMRIPNSGWKLKDGYEYENGSIIRRDKTRDNSK